MISACERYAGATGDGTGFTADASSGERESQSEVENTWVKIGGGAIRGLGSVSRIGELSRSAVDLGDTGLSGKGDTKLVAVLDVVFGVDVVSTLSGED